MSITNGIEGLRQVPLFRGLDDKSIQLLAGQLGEADFPAGGRIFEHGDPNSGLYLIRRGKVKVVLPRNGEEAILAIFGDGDFFGELSLCDGRPRSASVIALAPTSTWVLPREAFLQFIHDHPSAAIQVLDVISCRLRETTERFSEHIFLDLSARLAKRLLQMASACGHEGPKGVEIDRSLTVDEIAALLGATPSRVETEMRALNETGVIRWDGSRVIVRSPELLAERTRGGLKYVGLGHIAVPSWLLEP